MPGQRSRERVGLIAVSTASVRSAPGDWHGACHVAGAGARGDDGEVGNESCRAVTTDEVRDTDTSQWHLRPGLRVHARITSSIWHV